jgi:hypothetical protein
MKNLKRLVVAVALTLALGISSFAGIMQGPPCAPPEPGIILTPPCSGGQVASDPAAPGIIQGPPASEYSVAEVAITLLEGLLLY